MDKSADTWLQRNFLGSVIEFSAALSIIVLVAGYIWNHVVIAMAGLPPQTFTISDYVNSGASTAVLMSAVSLISVLSYAIALPWERPLSDDRLRILSYAIIGTTLLGVALTFGIGFYMESPMWVYGTATASAVVRVTAIAAVFIAARRLGPLRANATTLALVVAAGVWCTCATGAAHHASRAWGPAHTSSPVVDYQFDERTLSTIDWHPLLWTQSALYFVHRETGEALIIPAGRLVEMRQSARKADE